MSRFNIFFIICCLGLLLIIFIPNPNIVTGTVTRTDDDYTVEGVRYPIYAVDIGNKRYWFDGERQIGETMTFYKSTLEGLPYDFIKTQKD